MIAAPPLLIGASLLFWGWQSGNGFAAAGLALLLEVLRRVSLRFDLGAAEHARIADLCTILFVGLTAVLAVNRGAAHGILAAFQWLPVALAPILAAQLLSASGRVPLSALFRYLRKLKREDPATNDPLIDTSVVYVAIVMIAAGVANLRGPGYYAGVVFVTAWALWASRPRHASALAWALMLGGGAAAGYAGHAGLVQIQTAVENWVSEWYLSGFDGDPLRSTTDIGSIGRLKLLDTIVLRVYAPPAEGERLRLLHRASYNTYVGNTWLGRAAPLQAVVPDAGGLNWPLSSQPAQWRVRIATRLERGRILLALPSSTTRITGLAATAMRRNALGAVQAELAGDWIQYEAEAADGADTSAAPGAEELAMPAHERATFAALAEELRLHGLAPAEALRRVQDHFRGFAYSTWRERPAADGLTPLSEFLRVSRAGHCEYFAAATTLLLRAGGIPARYATGFAVMEYSTLENAWVVRARHAHAWTRAWDGARWIDLDTTPPVWFAEEARLAPVWQRLADLARWAGFRWSQRGELQASDSWYAVLALLVAILGWRLLRGRRVASSGHAPLAKHRVWQGADSDFYAVERALARGRLARSPEIALGAWLRGLAPALPPPTRERLHEALQLHLRYRFDPLGLDDEARARLKRMCRGLLTELGGER
ncbi:MAG: transglutaminase domain-containing protein [Betaproteobacteria bacterium]|nr:MAG: transglutaminase domain-containing protein [Betaproteobacteria bacterium]